MMSEPKSKEDFLGKLREDVERGVYLTVGDLTTLAISYALLTNESAEFILSTQREFGNHRHTLSQNQKRRILNLLTPNFVYISRKSRHTPPSQNNSNLTEMWKEQTNISNHQPQEESLEQENANISFCTVLQELETNLSKDILSSSVTNVISDYLAIAEIYFNDISPKYMLIHSHILGSLQSEGWYNGGFIREPDRKAILSKVKDCLLS